MKKTSDTSYLEYQWPEFAVKELNDNADDFFKVYYPNATAVNGARLPTRKSVLIMKSFKHTSYRENMNLAARDYCRKNRRKNYT